MNQNVQSASAAFQDAPGIQTSPVPASKRRWLLAVRVAADAKHGFGGIGDDMFIFQDRHGMDDGFGGQVIVH